MKKLITILATITVIGGAITPVITQQINKNQITQSVHKQTQLNNSVHRGKTNNSQLGASNLTAKQIANKLNTDGEYVDGGSYSANNVYFLKPTAYNQYADSNIVMQNFRDILRYDRGWDPALLNTFTFTHTLLKDYPNGNAIQVKVKKDGQTAQAYINLVAYKNPFLNLENQDTYNITFDVNLTPSVIQYLRNYFTIQSNTTLRLGYFYQVCDDGDYDTVIYDLPTVGTSFFPWWDRLETWMGDYGAWADCKSSVASCQADSSTDNAYEKSNLAFENALYNQIMHAKANTYLSVQVSWQWKGTGLEYWTNSNYHFW